MNAQSITDAFRNSSFFSDFPEDQLKHLVAISREVEYQARSEMFHEHQPAKDVYLITFARPPQAVRYGSHVDSCESHRVGRGKTTRSMRAKFDVWLSLHASNCNGSCGTAQCYSLAIGRSAWRQLTRGARGDGLTDFSESFSVVRKSEGLRTL